MRASSWSNVVLPTPPGAVDVEHGEGRRMRGKRGPEPGLLRLSPDEARASRRRQPVRDVRPLRHFP
jgi:hypothetical protein